MLLQKTLRCKVAVKRRQAINQRFLKEQKNADKEYAMKKILMGTTALLCLFLVACEKKTEAQIKIDDLLEKYEAVMNESKDFITKVKDVSEDELTMEHFGELLSISSKMSEITEQLKEFDESEFTEKQKKRFEVITEKLKTTFEDLGL